MRDVSAKTDTLRTAVAEARLRVSPGTIEMIRAGRVPKGDPIPVARIAGIAATKLTPQIIPYCHPVPVQHAAVEIEMRETEMIVRATVKAVYRTGVEMEALTAAAVAALNLYDILKMVDDEMVIQEVVLREKTGGKSDLRRPSGLSAAVLVVSDRVSRGEAEDRSGRLLRERLEGEGVAVTRLEVVPDEAAAIAQFVGGATEDLVVSTGGTGVGPRDVTPEAVVPLLDRELPGVVAAIHRYSQDRLPTAMLSRLVAGVRGDTVVLCLPGSPGAVADAMSAVFPGLLHAVEMVRGAGH